MESRYIKSLYAAKDFPDTESPEVALLGRSNCGKSSLLNAITERKSLARKGSTPGLTQGINLFYFKPVSECEMIIADLPGYGFSQTGRSKRKHWDELMTAYMQRSQLSLLILLLDCRRGLTEEDQGCIDFCLKHDVNLALCLTKTDKLKKGQIKPAVDKMKAQTDFRVFSASSLKKQGIQEIRDFMVAEVSEYLS